MFSDQCVINVFDFVLQTVEGWQARRTVFTDTLVRPPLSPWHALGTCWQEESDRQARRTPFETPVRFEARLPSRVTMATVFNSSVYVHGSRSCVKMCMPLITYRLSSFHFKRLWPGFKSHCLLTESLDPGLGQGAEDKLVRHEHRFVFQKHWCRGRQGLVCGMGSAESLNAAACHAVIFSTSSDSDKFGRVGGAVVSSFISDRVELSANMRMLNIAE